LQVGFAFTPKAVSQKLGLNMSNFINYNWLPTISDHVLDLDESFYRGAGVSRLHNVDFFDPETVKPNDIIFVKTDFIFNGRFQDFLLPDIQNHFKLISGNSDYQIGLNNNSYLKILNSEKLIKWACTNPPEIYNEKIIPLPIGFQEKERQGGNQELLRSKRENRTPFEHKKDKALLPHHTLNTNPGRKKLFDSLQSLEFVETQPSRLSFPEYLNKVNEYKYVICLEGSGPDTHRNYECLLMESIPINIKNTIKKVFDYHGLPGVFLDDWRELDLKNLPSQPNLSNVDAFLETEYHSEHIRQKTRRTK